MNLLNKNDLPIEFQIFYASKILNKFPENISNLQFQIPEKNLDDGKLSLFQDYLKLNNNKIIDEIHFSNGGLGFVENKKSEFPLNDIKKFTDFKLYYEKKYFSFRKIANLHYCVIKAKKLGNKKSKELTTDNKGRICYKHKKNKLYSIGNTKEQKVIPTYLVRGN